MRRGERGLTLALALALGGACTPAEDIQMTCTPVGDAVRLRDVPAVSLQLGRLDESVLLSWYELGTNRWLSRWYTLPELSPLGDVVDHGTGGETRPRWVERDGALEALLVTDPEGRPLRTLPNSEFVAWWRMAPGAEAARRAVIIPRACDECQVFLGAASAINQGFQGVFPAINIGGHGLGALSTIPEQCEITIPLLNLNRLHFIDSESLEVQPILWSSDSCNPGVEPGYELTVAVPWLISLDDARVGVIYRPLGSESPHYFVTSLFGEILSDPVDVGTRGIDRFLSFGGTQARGQRLGERLLVTEGLSHPDVCSALRSFTVEGADVRDAPWQLPCREDTDIRTYWIEMERIGARHAVLAWTESHNDPVAFPSRWFERVQVAVLDEDGQLASRPMVVTLPESTALLAPLELEPGTNDFPIALSATESGEVIVAWSDYRRDAPGVYAQRIECADRTP